MKQGWDARYRDKTITASAGVACVKPGARVFVGSGCAEPTTLVRALAERDDVSDVEVLHIMTIGEAPYAEAAARGRFRHNAFFIGSNVRNAIAQAAADYTPVFLSEIPALFERRRLKVDVAFVSVSPPDRHGYCSLGISVDVVSAAMGAARRVVAEVKPSMPRTHGASFVHVDRIDAFVESAEPVIELPPSAPDDVSRHIGTLCAGLVDDGATLQLGIGDIPNAVLASLASKCDLGLHTEMFADGVVDLIEAGVINGRKKTVHPGKAVTSFCMGSRRLYDFVDDNPYFEFLPTAFVNDPFVIGQNAKMISINSALQVDLTGQVCADSIGSRFYSGIGGQVDFIRGAARSRKGRSIIALPSTAKGGSISRIVSVLSEGAGVVTTRGDVHTIVTEYGIAELKGRTVRERSMALISIAHPDFRAELLAAAKERHFVTVEQVPWPDSGKPYPAELEERRAFGDVEIFFRPMRAADERLLREFFYSHSADTVYQRHHAPLKSLSPEQIQRLCALDYDAEMALAGFVTEGDAERMVAVGRYHLDRASGMAELAFTVHDDLQGHGIGTYLMGRLMDIARAHGVRGFIAYVLATNVRMLAVFHKCGVPVRSKLEDDTYTVRIPLTDLPSPP